MRESDSKDLPVVVLGDVDPIVGAALSSAWEGTLDVDSSTLRGLPLASRARHMRARALVVPPEEVAALSLAAPDVIVIGLSVESTEAYISLAGDVERVTNPSPKRLAERLGANLR